MQNKDEILRAMFDFKTKHHNKLNKDTVANYKELFFKLKAKQKSKEISYHKDNDYLNGNDLAANIFKRKYYLKDLDGNTVENRPEDVYVRLASSVGAVEKTPELREKYSKEFYEMLYEGYFMPGGRVLAGAGDLFRLKTLANCFVTVIEDDNIESIYKAAYDCARTYSYGGGIGVDISGLRPRDSVVHNAADKSTGAVSFMELYSMTTGLIGQSGRRGALMLTIDVKHPDVIDFITVKQEANWITDQIVQQCSWSGKFDQSQLEEVKKQVRENTQVRFANISLKVSDEFMSAVNETKEYKKNSFLVYKKSDKNIITDAPQNETTNYAYKIPSKNLSKYKFEKEFDTLKELNVFFETEVGTKDELSDEDFESISKRDIFGDVTIVTDKEYDFVVHRTGDFMLYFGSENTNDVKKLIKAEDIWDNFVGGNYTTAEPGLIFWDSMFKYSPSNYLGKYISSTNPCGEVPLEDGGACNLGSLNLSRFVKNGYDEDAELDWPKIEQVAHNIVRFLDNVISWNEKLNALKKQRDAAKETRRLGIGIMGIADMLNQMGLGYDSKEGIELIEKVTHFINEACYTASANLAKEKGPIPIWDYDKYSKGPFFEERLSNEVKALIKENGLRNIALTSIAPTGSISNIVLGVKDGDKHYIGVSGGVEPIFALFYTRRTETLNQNSDGKTFFKIFHSSVQAYIDKKGLSAKANEAGDMEGLRGILPEHFFRTSHFISAESRIKVQGACQKYIDHSISSTVNLPESVEPEDISNIYIDAWKNGLKGITIYRDGSRYPILSVEQEKSEFQDVKSKLFSVTINGTEEKKVFGAEVIKMPDGRLTTPFHAIKLGYDGVKLAEGENEDVTIKPEGDMSTGKKACKVEFIGGKLVKDCGD